MKLLRQFAALAVMLCLCATSARATTITYETAHLGGSQWRYDYTISNDTLAIAIEEFTLFFDHTVYANLAVATTPAGWDPLVIAPDAAIPAAGYFDALALTGGIAPGATLGGFALLVNYLGSGTPPAQAFSVIDPVSFAELDSGITIAASAVPVPPSAALMLAGLMLVTLRLRRNVTGGRP